MSTARWICTVLTLGVVLCLLSAPFARGQGIQTKHQVHGRIANVVLDGNGKAEAFFVLDENGSKTLIDIEEEDRSFGFTFLLFLFMEKKTDVRVWYEKIDHSNLYDAMILSA